MTLHVVGLALHQDTIRWTDRELLGLREVRFYSQHRSLQATRSGDANEALDDSTRSLNAPDVQAVCSHSRLTVHSSASVWGSTGAGRRRGDVRVTTPPLRSSAVDTSNAVVSSGI